MHFDVIIGNPPYNGGMDLDFIYKGHRMQKQYSTMIVPAKWLFCINDHGTIQKLVTNNGLRDILADKLKTVVYYPEVRDIFYIQLVGGALYYLDDHKQHNSCQVVNKCFIDGLNQERDTQLKGLYQLYNIVQDILDSIGDFDRLHIKNQVDDQFEVWMQSKCIGNNKTIKQYMFGSDGCYLYAPIHIFDRKNTSSNRYDLLQNCPRIIYTSNSYDEALSFVSYISTKLIKLLVLAQTVQYQQFIGDSMFSFVPDPGKFDHIFTDDELYKKYNISIDVQKALNRMFKDRETLLGS